MGEAAIGMKKSKRLSSKQAVPSGVSNDAGRGQRKLALSGKIIYLDIKDARQSQAICARLKKLGAGIETFLSKEVSYVISTSASPRSSSQTRGQGHGGIGPESPSYANTPSPFSATPSPTYLGADGKIIPVTRGQAMAQIARARNRSPSPSSVAASAEKLGIKIISVEGAVKWLNKELEKSGHSFHGDAGSSKNLKKKRYDVKYRKLQQSCIKFESTTQQYRPYFMELASWPHINVDTPPSTCPYDGQGFTAVQRSGCGDKDGAASVGNVPSPNTYSGATHHRRSMEGEESSRLLVGLPIVKPGDVRRQQEKRKKDHKRRGFCECCGVKYENIDKHVQEGRHREFARDKMNYESLDELMKGMPSTGEFLHSIIMQYCTRQAATKPNSSFQEPEEGDVENDDILTVDPNTPKKSHQTSSDVSSSRNLTFKHIAPDAKSFAPSRFSGQQRSALQDSQSVGDPKDVAVADREEEKNPGKSLKKQSAEAFEADQPGRESEADRQGRETSPSPLPTAVVIRRPGSKSILASPRRRPSPGRGEGQLTPKKVCERSKVGERSMIFSDSSIGSLCPVPEETAAGDRESLSTSYARLSQDSFADITADEMELGGRRVRRVRRTLLDSYSTTPSTDEIGKRSESAAASEGRVKSSAGSAVLKNSVGEAPDSAERLAGSLGDMQCKVPSRPSKRTPQEARKVLSDAGTLPRQENIEESADRELASSKDTSLETKMKGGGQRRHQGFKKLHHTNGSLPPKDRDEMTHAVQTQKSADVLPLKNAPRNSNGFDESQAEEVKSPSKYSLRSTPRKGQSLSSTAGLSPRRILSPQKRVQQELFEEEEAGSSPVYHRGAIHSSTPVVVTTRALRNTKHAIEQNVEDVSRLLVQEKSAVKKVKRAIFSPDSQPGASVAAGDDKCDESSQKAGDEAKGGGREEKRRRRSSRTQKARDRSIMSQETFHEQEEVISSEKNTASLSLSQSADHTDLHQPVAAVQATESETRPSLRVKLVRSELSSPQRSSKRVKLNRSWMLLSENSMSRLLHSEPEASPFKGFQGNEALPSDLSFESASEVEVTDNEEREWLIAGERRAELNESEGWGPDGESLHDFLPSFSSPGKRSDSSWDDACDLYLSHSVEQQLQRKRSAATPRASSSSTTKDRKRRFQSRSSEPDANSRPSKRRRTNGSKTNTSEERRWGTLASTSAPRMSTPTKKQRRGENEHAVGGVSAKGEAKRLSFGEDVVQVDEDVVFNYGSPRKDKQVLSPLRSLNSNRLQDGAASPGPPHQSPRTRSGVTRVLRTFKVD